MRVCVCVHVCPSSFLCESIRHLFDLTLSVNYSVTLCGGRCWPSRALCIDLVPFSIEVGFSLFTGTAAGPIQSSYQGEADT